jgi:hypothetical protein
MFKKLFLIAAVACSSLAFAEPLNESTIQMALIEVGRQVGEEYGLHWMNSTWRGNEDGQKLGALALAYQAPDIGNKEHANQLVMAAAKRALELINEREDLKGQIGPQKLGLEHIVIGIANDDNTQPTERALLSCVSLEFGDLFYQ